MIFPGRNGIAGLILLLLFVANGRSVAAESSKLLQLPSGQEFEIRRFAGSKKPLLLWLPSERGFGAAHAGHALDLAQAGFEVWLAAGSIDDAPIMVKTAESARSVLRPKVLGTLTLSEQLSGRPLDFFALCTSPRMIASYGVALAQQPTKDSLTLEFARRLSLGRKPRIFLAVSTCLCICLRISTASSDQIARSLKTSTGPRRPPMRCPPQAATADRWAC